MVYQNGMEENNKVDIRRCSRKEVLLCICSVLISAFSFIFYLISSNSYPLIYITLALIFVWCMKYRKIHIENDSIFWIISAFVIFVSSFFSNDSAALQYGITFVAFIFIMLVLKEAILDWRKYYFYSVGVFSSIHVFATILQFFAPEVIDSVNKTVLPATSYSENARLLQFFGAHAGITGQTGRNGLYISVALGFWIVLFITSSIKKKKVAYFGMIILSFAALLLTHKRTFLIIPIINILVLIKIRKKVTIKTLLRIVFVVILLLFIFSFLTKNIPELAFTFQRFNSSDITTGRSDLWKMGMEIAFEHPVFGVGILNSRNKIGMWPHNIYIQLFAELGLLCGGLVIFSMLHSLVEKIKICDYVDESNERYHLFAIYSQLLFLIYGFTGNPFFEIQVVGFYIITIALGVSRFTINRTCDYIE